MHAPRKIPLLQVAHERSEIDVSRIEILMDDARTLAPYFRHRKFSVVGFGAAQFNIK
jgi:hypothetical protein